MKQSDTEIELKLVEMVPAALDEQLLAKLETSMNHCQDAGELRSVEAELAQLEPKELSEDQYEWFHGAMDLAHVEAQLAEMSEVKISDSLLSKLESAMNEASEEPRIVAFEPAKKRVPFAMLASAAAVVAMAAIGLTVYGPSGGPSGYAQDKLIPTPTPNVTPVDLPIYGETPYGVLRENIVNASNEGVVSKDNKPHKRVRVFYEEVIEFIGPDGEVYEKRVPKEKVCLIPVETN